MPQIPQLFSGKKQGLNPGGLFRAADSQKPVKHNTKGTTVVGVCPTGVAVVVMVALSVDCVNVLGNVGWGPQDGQGHSEKLAVAQPFMVVGYIGELCSLLKTPFTHL